MRIAGFTWREDVVDKLAWKHNVTTEEIQEVFDNRPRIERIERGHFQGEDVYVAFGRTNAGRYLTVIFIYKKNRCALINTARDMTRKERRRYGRK